jgi:DNA repair protein RadA/Sms
MPPDSVAIGEVGLLGELRPVAGIERRLREAARLGFAMAIVPRPGRGGRPPETPGLQIVEVATLRDAIAAGLGEGPRIRGDAVPAMLG